MGAPGDLERDATLEHIDNARFPKPVPGRALIKTGARYDQLMFLPRTGGVPVAVTASNIQSMTADDAGVLSIATASAKLKWHLGDAAAAKAWREALVRLGARAA
jgi:hypothetical protein